MMITNVPFKPSRRRFVTGLTLGGAALGSGLGRGLPAFATTVHRQPLSGTEFDLSIGLLPINFTGVVRSAITVNGSLPAPTLRWRQGDTVTLRVANQLLAEYASIHWHGILLPAGMDGVPGLSFDGIGPGETFTYQFTLRQSGTYWYHSHSLFQEQAGLYGAIIIDPIGPALHHYDREHVVLLSDWTDLDPAALFRRLKKMSDHDNVYQRNAGDFIRDVQRNGLATTIDDRKAWGRMRMTPTDLSDVNANTYTYLINGTAPAGNWTGLFRTGEKVLLRFINGSSMTYFDVRIPGLTMTVVAADGQAIHPVTVDEFRIAVAETFDVLVEPSGQDAFSIFAQDMGRTGYARGTLAVQQGLEAPIPKLDARPIISMQDMGHGAHHGNSTVNSTMSHSNTDHGNTGHGSTEHGSTEHSDIDHSSMSHNGKRPAEIMSMQAHPASEFGNPLVDMQTMMPTAKLDDPGLGLRNNGRDVLTYADMHSLFSDPDGRDPGRTIELHLTGHMEKFAWSFNGKKFMDAEPLRLNYGERLRIVLVNDTMMSHPIHLHGMWSDLEDEQGNFHLRKHTIDMPPGTKRSYRVRADALGRWAYHCHLLYHMESGMMREVRVEE